MYLLYSLFFFFFLMIAVAYFTRHHWQPYIPLPSSGSPLYSRLPASFRSDVEAGLTSSTFDLSGNVMDGDGRGGLDEEAKKKVQRIMKRRRVGFDEARRIFMEERFKANGIGADGTPRDPKFVSFSA